MATEEVKATEITPPPQRTPSGQSKVREMSWLQKLRTEGCMPLHTVAFATGAALLVIACLTFGAKLLDLNVVAAINQVWLAIFGIIIMLLETRSYSNFLSKKINRWLLENMKILTYMTGRGIFYIFVGTLELGFWFSTLHLVVGIILCAVGALVVFVGWMLGLKLRTIRRELAQEDKARKSFHDFDVDMDGKLSSSELARLCHSMGSKLTHNELEAAITTMDISRDGYIQEEEFLRWWRGDATLKNPTDLNA